MDCSELLEEASRGGLIYMPKERKFVSPSLQTAVLKFGIKRVQAELTTARIRSMVNATRSNYRNIKRICDTTQDPGYCYMAESILPQLERILEEFEHSIRSAKPLMIYGIDENDNVGGLLLEIRRPDDY